MSTKKHTVTEAASVTLNTMDFRRAVSAAANAAKDMTIALEFTNQDERDRLQRSADECIDCLAALAFAQIRRVER